MTYRLSRAASALRVSLLLSAGIVATAGAPADVASQSLSQSSTGPVIEGYGPVFDIPDADFVPTDTEYRVVFDVAVGMEDPAQVNRRIETLARFLNMHARAGVPLERMHVALVVHGSAGKDLLADDGFQERYGIDNPNLPLIEALAEAGVEVYLCGQTAYSRGLPKDELAEPVQLALSAMTALIRLQSEGYELIAF